MKQEFALQPYSGMGKGQQGYRAKIVKRAKTQGRSLEDIARTVARKRGLLDADLLLYGFRQMMNEAISGAVETGEIQHLGDYGSLMMNIHGTFDGIDDKFDAARHSIDIRFVPGVALKGLKPGFELENVVSRKAPVVYEVAPFGYSGDRQNGLSRYAVRGQALGVNVDSANLGQGGFVGWEVETADRRVVSGRFTVIESDAAHFVLAWPSDLPLVLHRDEMTLVVTTRNGRAQCTPLMRRVKVALFDA